MNNIIKLPLIHFEFTYTLYILVLGLHNTNNIAEFHYKEMSNIHKIFESELGSTVFIILLIMDKITSFSDLKIELRQLKKTITKH